jgi:hypothetical protein
MYDYLLYGSLTFLLSILFSMGGARAGVALIPILNFLGLDLWRLWLEEMTPLC